MKIDIPLPCPKCGGKMYSVSYDSSFSILKKRSWQDAKNVILREIPKNSKKPFAVHNSIFHFCKGFLILTP